MIFGMLLGKVTHQLLPWIGHVSSFWVGLPQILPNEETAYSEHHLPVLGHSEERSDFQGPLESVLAVQAEDSVPCPSFVDLGWSEQEFVVEALPP